MKVNRKHVLAEIAVSGLWDLRNLRIRYLYILLLLLFTAAGNSVAYAQQVLSLTGKVVDASTNKPLAGVKIEDQQSKVLGVSDVKGMFYIKAKEGENVVLTMLGFEKYYYTVRKDSLNITLQLEPSTRSIDEVVVTALDIKREQKALGYSVTTLKTEELTETLPNNWTEALSGKVAGLNLVRSNAGPTGSNSIILRGESNLTGSNEALIVVDGVIINGGSGRRVGGSAAYQDETVVDYGTNVEDINPEDIEEVTVLKGPGAAALYGSRGANGAIIITTKTGKKKEKGIGVNFSSNNSMATINRMPDLQYEYGQGDMVDYYSYGSTEDGANTGGTSKAYGAKFDGQYFYQYDPALQARGTERTLWRPYTEGFNAFFETARTSTNSISVDGGTDKTTARFSYTNVQNSWIVPNTGYRRNTVSMSVNSTPSKYIKVTAKMDYTNKSSDNLPGGGYNKQTIMYGYIFWQPNGDVRWLRDYWKKGLENVEQNTPLSTGRDNPYLIAYEMLNTQDRNALTGNVAATFTLRKNLEVTVRTAIDQAADTRSQRRPFDTYNFPKGMYREQNVISREVNSDVMVKYNTQVGENVKINASVGGAMLRNSYNRVSMSADSLLYPGVFTFANAASTIVTSPYKAKYAINSVYGLIAGDYKGFAFLDFTLRNDWSSLLATPTSTKNVSYFYPSVNGSLILSDIINLPRQVNFLKWRASVAGVGSGGTSPFQTSNPYLSSQLYTGGGLYNPTTLSNENLKPLFTLSYETGIEAKFFKERVGLDFTLYHSNTRDQILTTILDRSSGYSNMVVNAGEVRNRGIEVALNLTPIKKRGGLTWTVNTTFSKNENKILSLAENTESLILQNGPGSNGYVMAYVGGSMGDLYGRGYKRAPSGEIIYNAGLPVLSEELLYLGNTTPDWKAGIQNKFKYKGFSLGFLFDAQVGAVAYSLTQGKMAVQGKTKVTLPGRENGIVGRGVVENEDGTYSPNTVAVYDMSSYYDQHFGVANVEGSVFSTDFIKLREVRFDYSFKAKVLQKVKLQKLNIGVYGRDLFIWSKWPGFDPEFGTLSGSEINRGFEIGQFPSTRTYGVNLSVGF